jgi:hypothetical protein
VSISWLVDTSVSPSRFGKPGGGAALQTGTQAWTGLDGDALLDRFTPPQRLVQDAATPRFAQAAETMETAGRGSNTPLFEDFATLGAVYLRAYVAAVPSYTPADRDLALAGLGLGLDLVGVPGGGTVGPTGRMHRPGAQAC